MLFSWKEIAWFNSAFAASKGCKTAGLYRPALGSGLCLLAFSAVAVGHPLPVQEADCELHAMAAYPQPGGDWEIDPEPYGSSYLRKTAAGPFQIMTQQGPIKAEPVTQFEEAQDLLRAMGLNDRTPPAWRPDLIDASENVTALDAISYDTGEVLIEMVLVRIDVPAPQANLPGGAILGAARLPNHADEGEWLYAQLWGTGCFGPE